MWGHIGQRLRSAGPWAELDLQSEGFTCLCWRKVSIQGGKPVDYLHPVVEQNLTWFFKVCFVSVDVCVHYLEEENVFSDGASWLSCWVEQSQPASSLLSHRAGWGSAVSARPAWGLCRLKNWITSIVLDTPLLLLPRSKGASRGPLTWCLTFCTWMTSLPGSRSISSGSRRC